MRLFVLVLNDIDTLDDSMKRFQEEKISGADGFGLPVDRCAAGKPDLSGFNGCMGGRIAAHGGRRSAVG